jgi:hypothetical protein
MMETTQTPLTPAQRQANIDRFIKRWKEERAKVEEEAEALRNTQEYQFAIQQLKKRNAERGTPKVTV